MPERIAQPLQPRSIHRQGGGGNAADLKPTEIHRKDTDDQCRQEEGRQADAGHGEHRHAVIHEAVLMRCRLDAKRNGDQELQKSRYKRDGKGNAHVLEDDVLDRLLVLEGHTEVAPDDIEQPAEVAAEDSARLIPEASQTVLCRDGQLGPVGQCADHLPDGGSVSALPGDQPVCTALHGRVFLVQRNQGTGSRGLRLPTGSLRGRGFRLHVQTAGLDRADGKGTVGIDDQAGIVRSVIGALIPCLPCHESQGNVLVIRCLFGVLGKGVPGEGAARTDLHAQVGIRHGKSVQLLDPIHVLLPHGSLRNGG